jgi:hypothetical protein
MGGIMMHLPAWERHGMDLATYKAVVDRWLALAYALIQTGVPVMEALARTKQEAGAGVFN